MENTNIVPPSAIPEADLLREVATLIVSALSLELAPEEIAPDAPLYGEGLGLDSVDILEIALAVSKRFGFNLRSDNADNAHIFSSLKNLSHYIAQHRTL